jgi:hypothetical protein
MKPHETVLPTWSRWKEGRSMHPKRSGLRLLFKIIAERRDPSVGPLCLQKNWHLSRFNEMFHPKPSYVKIKRNTQQTEILLTVSVHPLYKRTSPTALKRFQKWLFNYKSLSPVVFFLLRRDRPHKHRCFY